MLLPLRNCNLLSVRNVRLVHIKKHSFLEWNGFYSIAMKVFHINATVECCNNDHDLHTMSIFCTDGTCDIYNSVVTTRSFTIDGLEDNSLQLILTNLLMICWHVITEYKRHLVENAFFSMFSKQGSIFLWITLQWRTEILQTGTVHTFKPFKSWKCGLKIWAIRLVFEDLVTIFD